MGTVVTTLNILNFFFAPLIFMHLVSPLWKMFSVLLTALV